MLRSDFNVEYVARYTSLELPSVYKITALWGGNAGSLLLWLWQLTLFAAIVTFQTTGRHPDLAHRVVLDKNTGYVVRAYREQDKSLIDVEKTRLGCFITSASPGLPIE